MFLFRALNEYEILTNPLDNGLSSKIVINDIAKNYYENQNINYNNLSKEEKKEYIKKYIVSHRHKLEKMYYKHSKDELELVNIMHGNSTDEKIKNFIQYEKILSTLQSHLITGSKIDTNWISTTKEIYSLKKYYYKQDIHKVALINIIPNKNNLCVDVSSKEIINNNSLLCNKINCDNKVVDILSELSKLSPEIAVGFNKEYINKTSINSRGYNYSTSSNEVCIYKYIPSENIHSVLEALQMDLIFAQIFNIKYFELNKKEQIKQHSILRNNLRKIIVSINDIYLLHVYDELYENNKNINSLVTYKDSKEKIIYNRNKIIRLAKTIPNIQIK